MINKGHEKRPLFIVLLFFYFKFERLMFNLNVLLN